MSAAQDMEGACLVEPQCPLGVVILRQARQVWVPYRTLKGLAWVGLSIH